MTAAEFSSPTPAATDVNDVTQVEPLSIECSTHQMSFVGDFIPSLGSMRAVLAFFIANPKAFLTISTSIEQLLHGQTAVAKWDNGIHPLGHSIAAYIDTLKGDEKYEASIFSGKTEEELADEVCTKALAIRGVYRTLGVQGSTGLQINRGEVLRFAGTFLQKILPSLLPLLPLLLKK